MEVYRPAEDSYLLAKYVEKLVEGEVLDVGTGSGIQAVTAAKKSTVRRVVASDLNPYALIEAEKRAVSERVQQKIEFVPSDLFENISEGFDWILFNTPYLPSEGEADEYSWAGGETGSEVIKRFLSESKHYLKAKGSILMIYSSHSNMTEADFSGFKYELLEEMPLFFEKLYCVRLSPSLGQ